MITEVSGFLETPEALIVSDGQLNPATGHLGTAEPGSALAVFCMSLVFQVCTNLAIFLMKPRVKGMPCLVSPPGA